MDSSQDTLDRIKTSLPFKIWPEDFHSAFYQNMPTIVFKLKHYCSEFQVS